MKKRILFTITACFLLATFTVNGQSEGDFYDTETIQEINISFEQENWRYLLDSLRYNGEDMLLGSVEINGVNLDDVGVRFRDGKTHKPGIGKNGLVIVLNFIKKNQNYQGVKVIDLSTALRDPSMVREVLSYEIARNYMPAPRANYSNVNVNDKGFGLFVNVEAINNEFTQRNFNSQGGSLFRSAPKYDQREPEGCKSKMYGSLQYDNSPTCYLHQFQRISESGWDDLIELTRVLNEDPESIDQVLNVDRTLWMHAFNNVLVNLYSYSGQYNQNYYLYQEENGQFTPILSHLNLSFASFKNTGVGSDLGTVAALQLDPLLHQNDPNYPLISQLLSDEDNRKAYLSHMRTILYKHFLSGDYATRAKGLQGLIRDAVINDENKVYELEDFDKSLDETIGTRSKIPGIVDFMEKRIKFLQTHASLRVIPPTVKEISIARRERFAQPTDSRLQDNSKF